MWADWSSSATNAAETRELERNWRGFPYQSHTIGLPAVFRAARDNGWRPKVKYEYKKFKPSAIKSPPLRWSNNQRAIEVLRKCTMSQHKYIQRKGLKFSAPVFEDKLVIPVYCSNYLISIQMIDEQGQKKFLSDSKTKYGSFVFGSGFPQFVCEGWITGYTLNMALQKLMSTFSVKVAFSAHNIGNVIIRNEDSYVIADNDSSKTGERVAERIGLPYWMPQETGYDANDVFKTFGMNDLVQRLQRFLYTGAEECI